MLKSQLTLKGIYQVGSQIQSLGLTREVTAGEIKIGNHQHIDET